MVDSTLIPSGLIRSSALFVMPRPRIVSLSKDFPIQKLTLHGPFACNISTIENHGISFKTIFFFTGHALSEAINNGKAHH